MSDQQAGAGLRDQLAAAAVSADDHRRTAKQALERHEAEHLPRGRVHEYVRVDEQPEARPTLQRPEVVGVPRR